MNTSISSGCVRLRLLFIFGDLWNRGYLRTYSMYVRMVSTYVCYDTYTISLHLTYRYPVPLAFRLIFKIKRTENEMKTNRHMHERGENGDTTKR